jgi:hypothetical protein
MKDKKHNVVEKNTTFKVGTPRVADPVEIQVNVSSQSTSDSEGEEDAPQQG